MRFFAKKVLEKYVRYYFGEILVVVFGIFIAIQLNNRKINKRQKRLLSDFCLI